MVALDAKLGDGASGGLVNPDYNQDNAMGAFPSTIGKPLGMHLTLPIKQKNWNGQFVALGTLLEKKYPFDLTQDTDVTQVVIIANQLMMKQKSTS